MTAASTPKSARAARTAPLRQLIAPGRAQIRRAAMISALMALIWPAQAALVAAALGGMVSGSDGPSAPLAAGLFAALAILRSGLGHLADRAGAAAAQAVVTHARDAVIAREAARAPESSAPTNPGSDDTTAGAGALAALAGEKIDLLAPYVLRYAPAQARTMLVPLVILTLAFWHSWAAGLILMITGPLIPVFMALVGMAAKQASERQLAEVATLNDLLVERLSAMGDIRLLGAGPQVTDDFTARASNLRQRTMAVLRVAFLSSTVLELFAAIGVAMMAVYVGFTLLGAIGFGTWGHGLTPEAGLFLLLLAPEFYQPLRDLATAWHDRAAAQAVAEELAAYHAQPFTALPGAGLPGAGLPQPRLPGPASVELRGCTTPSGQTLPQIRIAPGEKVALVGPSGAGKTTALRLMAGLSLPETGEVLVAGQPLQPENADGWRARLGWMPQAPHFLDASLRQNIALGRPGDLTPALRAAAAWDIVQALPQGLATRLGETGGGLSGGEARRLTLARALHGAPDLILADEPTADLDAETARAVTKGLLDQAARGAGLVIATHDMALAAQMDRIIRIGTGDSTVREKAAS